MEELIAQLVLSAILYWLNRQAHRASFCLTAEGTCRCWRGGIGCGLNSATYQRSELFTSGSVPVCLARVSEGGLGHRFVAHPNKNGCPWRVRYHSWPGYASGPRLPGDVRRIRT